MIFATAFYVSSWTVFPNAHLNTENRNSWELVSLLLKKVCETWMYYAETCLAYFPWSRIHKGQDSVVPDQFFRDNSWEYLTLNKPTRLTTCPDMVLFTHLYICRNSIGYWKLNKSRCVFFCPHATQSNRRPSVCPRRESMYLLALVAKETKVIWTAALTSHSSEKQRWSSSKTDWDIWKITNKKCFFGLVFSSLTGSYCKGHHSSPCSMCSSLFTSLTWYI